MTKFIVVADGGSWADIWNWEETYEEAVAVANIYRDSEAGMTFLIFKLCEEV